MVPTVTVKVIQDRGGKD